MVLHGGRPPSVNDQGLLILVLHALSDDVCGDGKGVETSRQSVKTRLHVRYYRSENSLLEIGKLFSILPCEPHNSIKLLGQLTQLELHSANIAKLVSTQLNGF